MKKKTILLIMVMAYVFFALCNISVPTISASGGGRSSSGSGEQGGSSNLYGTYGIWQYSISNNEVEIIGCDLKVSGEAVIPETIASYPVTSIGKNAFFYCTGLTSVVIPRGVTNIDDGTFYYCKNLAIIKIPDTVINIGDEAFCGCESLTNAVIPDSVTSIGRNAFYGCANLTDIIIGCGVTNIGNSAFSDCGSLENINVDAQNLCYSSLDGNLYNKEKTTFIQYSIGKKDTSFIIPNTVTNISPNAFYGCGNLVNITIPDSVKNISWDVFSKCKCLINIDVNIENTNYCSLDGNLYNKSKSVLIQYAIGKKDTDFIIPESVKTVYEKAFHCSEYLTNILIPDSVQQIGWNAFSYCSKLKSVIIGNGVTRISRSAFAECGDLTSITLPNSVTSIDEFAFSNCCALKSITIPNSITSIGNYAFYDCSSLLDVYYDGTQDEWNNIDISDSGNNYLNSATIHYQAISAKTKTTVSEDGKNFNIVPVNVAIGNTIILALYNGNELAETQSEVYNDTDISFTTDKTYTSAKVMVWDSLKNMKPVCDVEIVK